MKIILLNGPPGSGKDTVGSFFSHYEDVFATKFAKYLKDAAHRALGLDVKHNEFETSKNEPNPLFYGISPREWYIAVSEWLFKPALGIRFFGERVVEAIQEAQRGADKKINYVVITDSGFREEVLPLIEAFGAENIYLFQIHRPGYDFKGDSRKYVRVAGVKTAIIENGKAILDLRKSTARAFSAQEALVALAERITTR